MRLINTALNDVKSLWGRSTGFLNVTVLQSYYYWAGRHKSIPECSRLKRANSYPPTVNSAMNPNANTIGAVYRSTPP